ncbi:DUF222 domain-containing protein, partial [Mycobacterium tuberculosis]|nr:DUF222 domain-containing protein [Mycobacterium tuberculosis]
ALAKHATAWGPLSAPKLEKAIDSWIDRYDPAAPATYASVIPMRTPAPPRCGGRLYATDAAMLDRRLTEMAHGVCEDDPRTLAQRRADALGALAAGATTWRAAAASPTAPPVPATTSGPPVWSSTSSPTPQHLTHNPTHTYPATNPLRGPSPRRRPCSRR